MEPADIRELRRELEFTQSQLAQFLGVHSLTVSKWERDILAPSPYHTALMKSFRRARKKSPGIGAVVGGLVVGAGIGVALYHLLQAAFGEDEDA